MLVSVTSYSQSLQSLKDSLKQATDELAYHPDSIDLRIKKVSWNIQLEQWSYAKDDLDKVLFLDPQNVAGLYYRAFVNTKLGRYKFARLDYHNFLAIYAARGGIEKERGFLELALEDYTQAMKHDSKNHDYILNRIDLLILLKRKKEAKDELDRLVSMGVNRAELVELYKKKMILCRSFEKKLLILRANKN